MSSLLANLLVFVVQLTSTTCITPDETIPSYLAKYGIEVETHSIITDDHYILETYRLPRPGAKVVLFQHGILDSAWCFINNDPAIAPALKVYYMGYDVWLTNSRGNTYSKKHETLDPFLSKDYWNFSFAAMGRHDVPANIDHVLSKTGQKSLTFAAHSQGTSQFFVAMTDPTTKAEMEKKVNLFVAFAPVAYLSHQSALMFKLVGAFHLGGVFETLYPYGIFDFAGVAELAHYFCKATGGLLCQIGVDTVCGSSPEDTSGAITNISAHFPAGTSVKSLVHYEQLMDSGNFEDFQQGGAKPQKFDLSTAKVPTALFVGTHDDLGDPIDARRIVSDLPSSTLVFHEEFPDFSHITWIAGTWSSFQAWFPKFEGLLQKYNPIKEDLIV